MSAQVKISVPQIYEVSKAIFSAFARHGVALAELALKRADLEDVFLELTESGESSMQEGEEAPEEASTVSPTQSPTAEAFCKVEKIKRRKRPGMSPCIGIPAF